MTYHWFKLDRYPHTAGIVAAISSAIAASICCIGPMVLLGLGVTGVHFFEVLEPYRPFIILLELAGYLFYKQTARGQKCEQDGICSTEEGHRLEQFVFWAVLFVAVAGIVSLSIS